MRFTVQARVVRQSSVVDGNGLTHGRMQNARDESKLTVLTTEERLTWGGFVRKRYRTFSAWSERLGESTVVNRQT